MCDDPYHSNCKTAAGAWALFLWIVAVLALLLLFGCTPCKTEPVWAMPEGAAAKAMDESPALEAGDWPEEAWWLQFNDPQLEQLITTGLIQNPRIDVADMQVLLAGAEAGITRARLYPTLDFNADITRYRYSKNGIFGAVPITGFPFSNTQYEFSLNFAYELDWWGKNRAALRSAIGEIQTRKAETAQARLILSSAIARSYFTLQMQMARAAVAEARVQNYAKRIELTQLRVRHNVEAILPVNTLISNYHNAIEFLKFLEQSVELEKNSLRALLAGNFDEEIYRIDFVQTSQVPFQLPSKLELDLLARRPDIVAQMWRVETASENVNVAEKQFYPNLNLLGLIGMQSLHAQTWLKNHSQYGQGGPALHLPLFEGGALVSNLEANKNEYALAVYQYENTLINALKEVLDGIINIKKQSERNGELILVAENNQQNWNLTQERLQHNLSSQIDVLTAQDAWLLANDNLIQGQAASLVAQINLINALGGGYDNNPLTCNGEALARSNP